MHFGLVEGLRGEPAIGRGDHVLAADQVDVAQNALALAQGAVPSRVQGHGCAIVDGGDFLGGHGQVNEVVSAAAVDPDAEVDIALEQLHLGGGRHRGFSLRWRSHAHPV